ncbi:lysozyme inhibitor LprI family protein [Pararhodobacter zhoushanensis]|uniref:lysozyme inhibitor LprI family protein n=1 Tax=Pararhodobacter zhoushanensis TaxID=2479545 RepID=UPI001FEB2A20|nr:lysozyme inhibitor LprI family protein [Pararhodobacter zhoushanensis]
MRLLSLTLIAFAVPAAALADPTMECPGASQIEIGACVTDTLAAVDLAIDSALGFAQASAQELDSATGRPVTVPALDTAQAAWSAWRDAQCDYVGTTYSGGSGTGIAITACKITLGRDRVDQLMEMVR